MGSIEISKAIESIASPLTTYYIIPYFTEGRKHFFTVKAKNEGYIYPMVSTYGRCKAEIERRVKRDKWISENTAYDVKGVIKANRDESADMFPIESDYDRITEYPFAGRNKERIIGGN